MTEVGAHDATWASHRREAVGVCWLCCHVHHGRYHYRGTYEQGSLKKKKKKKKKKAKGEEWKRQSKQEKKSNKRPDAYRRATHEERRSKQAPWKKNDGYFIYQE